MESDEQPTVIDKNDARGAKTSGVTRYVLGVSIGLAVLAMVLFGVFAM